MKASNYFYLAVIFTLSIFSCGKEELEIEQDTKTVIAIEEPGIQAEDLALNVSTCFAGDEAVTVIKRGNLDLNYFNTEDYRIIWTINNHQIIGSGITTDCLCGKLIHVKVIDLRDESSATISYNLVDCVEGDGQ